LGRGMIDGDDVMMMDLMMDDGEDHCCVGVLYFVFDDH